MVRKWIKTAGTPEEQLFFAAPAAPCQGAASPAALPRCLLCEQTLTERLATTDEDGLPATVALKAAAAAVGPFVQAPALLQQQHMLSPAHVSRTAMLDLLLYEAERWADGVAPLGAVVGGAAVLGVSPQHVLDFSAHVVRRWEQTFRLLAYGAYPVVRERNDDSEGPPWETAAATAALTPAMGHVNVGQDGDACAAAPPVPFTVPLSLAAAVDRGQGLLTAQLADKGDGLCAKLAALADIGVIRTGLLRGPTTPNGHPSTLSYHCHGPMVDLSGLLVSRLRPEEFLCLVSDDGTTTGGNYRPAPSLVPTYDDRMTDHFFHRLECIGDHNWGDQTTRRLQAFLPELDWTGSVYGPFLLDALRTNLESNSHLAYTVEAAGLHRVLRASSEQIKIMSAKFKADALEGICGELWLSLWALEEGTCGDLSEMALTLRDPGSRVALPRKEVLSWPSHGEAVVLCRLIETALKDIYDLVLLAYWQRNFSASLRAIVRLARGSVGALSPPSGALLSSTKRPPYRRAGEGTSRTQITIHRPVLHRQPAAVPLFTLHI